MGEAPVKIIRQVVTNDSLPHTSKYSGQISVLDSEEKLSNVTFPMSQLSFWLLH